MLGGQPEPMADTPAAGGTPSTVDDLKLTFPDLPRLELDQLLTQLVDRAGEVLAAQGRLRGLLRANQAIIGDLALPTVLRRITEAARDLVGARYAALGVLAGDGRLAEFIHVGMPEDVATTIGHLPEGKGLLGALIDDPRPIRIPSISADDRSSGFPPGHPPMASFLGVPIVIRDEVFGNLYLAESLRGEFSAEDEELTKALAATAAVAIDNARHYRDSRRQSEWMAATAEVTRRMLAPGSEDPLRLIAQRSRELADADLVTVSLPVAGDPGRLQIAVADTAGGSAELTTRLSGGQFEVATSLSGSVLTSGEAVRLADPHDLPDRTVALVDGQVDLGPMLLIPLLGAGRATGVLSVVRLAGRPAFSEDELAMAVVFANQAAVALELSEARAEQERARLSNERERIAADLHDHVIQRLFGSGLTLHGLAARMGPGQTSDKLLGVINDLDDTIGQIRTSIFALQRVGSPAAESMRAKVLDVVTGSAESLGFTPALRFSGPIDSLLAAGGDDSGRTALIDDIIAVLREALSNVARHAQAQHVDVDLSVDDGPAGTLTLTVADDGVGIGATGRSSGLANQRSRAEQRGGTMTIGLREPRGTALIWTVPLGSQPGL